MNQQPSPDERHGLPAARQHGSDHGVREDVITLDPDLLDPSPFRDRLEGDETDYVLFRDQIAANRQKTPILVRPHPGSPGRFQIVCGHRRTRAARDLGRQVMAIIRELDDDELVVAQGQDNAARADLTFIEKALFAAALEKKGFRRVTIMAALAVDKTGLSRLISAATRIPMDLIQAIGPAKDGRDRWMEVSDRLGNTQLLAEARRIAEDPGFRLMSCEARFRTIEKAVARKKKTPDPEMKIRASGGALIASVREYEGKTSIAFGKGMEQGFMRFVAERLPALLDSYIAQRQDKR